MEELKKKLISLWESGATIPEIVRIMPCRAVVTKTLLKEMKASGELKPRKTKGDITREKVLYLYHSGVTNPYEIAEYYNLSIHTIKNVLSNAKLSRGRPPHNYKERKPRDISKLSKNTQLIIADLKSGLSVREISRKYDISTQWIHIIKAKYISKGE